MFFLSCALVFSSVCAPLSLCVCFVCFSFVCFVVRSCFVFRVCARVCFCVCFPILSSCRLCPSYLRASIPLSLILGFIFFSPWQPSHRMPRWPLKTLMCSLKSSPARVFPFFLFPLLLALHSFVGALPPCTPDVVVLCMPFHPLSRVFREGEAACCPARVQEEEAFPRRLFGLPGRDPVHVRPSARHGRALQDERLGSFVPISPVSCCFFFSPLP